MRTIADLYQIVRKNGACGRTTKPSSLHYRNWSHEIVVFVLGNAFVDIAEEDDGTIFSVKDWELIEKSVDAMDGP